MNSFDAAGSLTSLHSKKFFKAQPCDRSGILLLDKPEGITSYGVVDKVKRILQVKKVGHCGTLDPFATGVLVVCIGQATRISDQLLMQDKTYAYTARLGVETDTLDRTGQIVSSWAGDPPNLGEVEVILQSFMGHTTQQVPYFSAVKVGGKRLHQLARKGTPVDLPTRSIQIKRLRLLRYEWPDMDLEVTCSKGTYVRQLAADMGRKLGCGAHVKDLRRLASGAFTLEKAVSLEELVTVRDSNHLDKILIPMSEALAHLPSIAIEDQGLREGLANGQLSTEWQKAHQKRFGDKQSPVCLLSAHGSLLALWWPHSSAKGERRLRIFQND